MRAQEAAPPQVPLAAALQVAPDTCFDAASLAPVMARVLQRDTLDRRIRVEIAGQAGSPEGLIFRVWREGRIAGERRFPGLSGPCEEVRAAVGLAAALAVEATVLSPEAPAPTPPVEPALPIAPPPDPLAPNGGFHTGFSASLDFVALFGALPSPAPAFAPGIGIRPMPPFELRLSGLFTGRGWIDLDQRSVGVALFAGRADACAVIPVAFARARACAGIEAGSLRAVTGGPATSFSPSAPWAAAIGRADVRVSLRPWLGVVLGADAIFPFTRPRFLVERPGGAQIAGSGLPAAGGAVSLGPEITFR